MNLRDDNGRRFRSTGPKPVHVSAREPLRGDGRQDPHANARGADPGVVRPHGLARAGDGAGENVLTHYSKMASHGAVIWIDFTSASNLARSGVKSESAI